MSLLTMIMNPDRAKDLSDMVNKLDRLDALIRDHENKLAKDQAALFARLPKPWPRTGWLGEQTLTTTRKSAA